MDGLDDGRDGRTGRKRKRVGRGKESGLCSARKATRRDNEMKEGRGAGELAAVTGPFVTTRLRRATLTKRQRDTCLENVCMKVSR